MPHLYPIPHLSSVFVRKYNKRKIQLLRSYAQSGGFVPPAVVSLMVLVLRSDRLVSNDKLFFSDACSGVQ